MTDKQKRLSNIHTQIVLKDLLKTVSRKEMFSLYSRSKIK